MGVSAGLAQRMDALERANETRMLRAELKRDLRAGRIKFRDVCLEPPVWLEAASVLEVLLSVHRMGRVTALAAFRRAGVPASKTFGQATERQRLGLLRELGRRV